MTKRKLVLTSIFAVACVSPSCSFSPVVPMAFQGQRRIHSRKYHSLPLPSRIRRRERFGASIASSSSETDASSLQFSNNNNEEHNNNNNTVIDFVMNTIPAQLEEGLEVLLHQLRLPRALEIRVVLLKEIVQPFVASFLETTKNHNDEADVDWEKFWAQPSGKYTNARHVARALEELGPIYVKFGQLLAARPDIVPQALADELLNLQDNMQPFDTDVAHQIIRQELEQTDQSQDFVDQFMDSLTADPVGAASIGQVYRGTLPTNGTAVAVKVKRPDIEETVARDAELLRSFAAWLESWTLPGQKNRRLIAVRIVDAVDEFINRILEEMDYRQEAINTQTFKDYYSENATCPYDVVVPRIYPAVCTENVLVLEWIDGEKIANCRGGDNEDDDPQVCQENLQLIKDGIEFTLWQLLDTGLVHADPHLGNLLKVNSTALAYKHPVTLAYLDFGILSTVSQDVRDSIVCAVVDLVFAQNVTAIAQLFSESQLLSFHHNQTERTAFEQALNDTYYSMLGNNEEIEQESTPGDSLPKLRVDKVLLSLSKLVTQFQFTLPPYFFNNARALVTLEGIARRLDPDFNIMGIIYPFALDRLWNNPTVSSTVEDNFRRMFRSPETDMLDINVFLKMITEMSKITDRSRPRVFLDAMKARGARRVFRHIWLDMANAFVRDLAKRVKHYHQLLRSSSRSFVQTLRRRLTSRRARRQLK